MYQARVVKVMIASPSDVATEREAARDVIRQWNDLHAEERKIVMMPVGWESHARPELGDRPQALINKTVLQGCDVVVGIFWTRIGTPTGAAASGTVEEINEHVAAGKTAMIYFPQVFRSSLTVLTQINGQHSGNSSRNVRPADLSKRSIRSLIFVTSWAAS